uniref:Uncharacterized protein n=1 Tax=Helianthus annuus TaxID=4232 RepID=A0A251RX28_HELAN
MGNRINKKHRDVGWPRNSGVEGCNCRYGIWSHCKKKLISYDLEKSSENLRENFDAFLEGLLSVPVAIP